MAMAGGAVRGEGGGSAGLKAASAVNNFFRGNIQQPLLCALSATPSNYSPRPPVIIPITSRTEESVTQHVGQGEGKATEQWINISFTHPASPSRAWIKFTYRGGWREREKDREGERKGEEGRKKEGKETRSTENNDTRPLISSGFWEEEGGKQLCSGDGAAGRQSHIIIQEGNFFIYFVIEM